MYVHIWSYYLYMFMYFFGVQYVYIQYLYIIIYIYIYINIYTIYTYTNIWMKYHDLMVTSLEWWLAASFMSVNYINNSAIYHTYNNYLIAYRYISMVLKLTISFCLMCLSEIPSFPATLSHTSQWVLVRWKYLKSISPVWQT